MPVIVSPKNFRAACHGMARSLVVWLMASVLVVALAFFYADRIGVKIQPGPVSGESSKPGYPSQVYYGPANSIAVLAFEDSGPGGNSSSESFLAAGFSDSLIRRLVQNPKLQVTSASSSLYFQGAQVELPVLAERLKVSHILEGSFQEMENSLQFTARLVRIDPNKELWSDAFITTKSELQLLRDQVSTAVASAMNRAPGAGPVEKELNPDAWLLLLEGRHLLRQRGLENLYRAEAAFTRSLEWEPGSSEAWLGLAELYLDSVWPGSGSEPGHEQARQAALTAFELNPDLAGAHVVLSKIRRNFDWNWRGAREASRLALELEPGNAEVLSTASDNEFTFGNFEKAVELQEAAISRDPVILPHLLGLGLLYEFSGDYDNSLIAYRRLLGLNPDYPAVRAFRARVKIAQDKPGSALREAEQETDTFWKRYARTLALIALERFDEADALIEEMIDENAGEAAFQIAEILAYRGDVDLAFEWLDRAREQRDGGMSELIGNQFLAVLEGDERWNRLMILMGLQ